jgi:hypothetical protein
MNGIPSRAGDRTAGPLASHKRTSIWDFRTDVHAEYDLSRVGIGLMRPA